MLFGLKNNPTMFSKVVIYVFREYIHKFFEVYSDDWILYSLLKDNIEKLRLMLNRCR
jgi:hypothetical protein